MFRINGFNSTKFGRLPIEKLMQGYADQNNELKGYVPLAYDGGGNSFMLILKKKVPESCICGFKMKCG